MIHKDKNGTEIKDGDALLFSLEDSIEPSGFNKYVSPVRLCFYSEIEKRYIPLLENYQDGNVEEAEVVRIQKP